MKDFIIKLKIHLQLVNIGYILKRIFICSWRGHNIKFYSPFFTCTTCFFHNNINESATKGFYRL